VPDKKASFVEPMECLSVARLPDGSQWLWEIKLVDNPPLPPLADNLSSQ